MKRNDLHSPPQSVVIVGGGTLGRMTAAGLCSVFSSLNLDLTLDESEHIGTIGIGEATLPHIRSYNQKLGICENVLPLARGAQANNSCHHYFMRPEQSGRNVNIDDFLLPITQNCDIDRDEYN